MQFNVSWAPIRSRCCIVVTYLVCLCSVGLCESGDDGFAGSFDLEYFVGDPFQHTLTLYMYDC